MNAWTKHGTYNAVRNDGVTAAFVHQSGTYPYAVHRGRGKTFEWLRGRARSSRCFRTLAAAMKAADKSWPL